MSRHRFPRISCYPWRLALWLGLRAVLPAACLLAACDGDESTPAATASSSSTGSAAGGGTGGTAAGGGGAAAGGTGGVGAAGGEPWPLGGGPAGGGSAADCQWGWADTGLEGAVPDLAAAADGTVHLSYVGDGHVQLAAIGSAAVETVPSSANPQQTFRKPRIAWGGDAVHLAWGSSAQDLQYARRAAAGWVREQVTSVSAQFSVPQIAATPDGSAHIVYQWCETQQCPTSATVYWHRPAGGGWQGPEPLSDAAVEWRDDALAADSLGRLHGVWKAAHQPGQSRRRSAAGVWEPPQQIMATPGGTTVSFGDLTTAADGRAHHAYFEFGSSGIAYVRGQPDGSWSAAELIAGPALESSDDYDMRPGIAVSGSGLVTVAWAQWTGGAGGSVGPIMVCHGSSGQWGCGELAATSGVIAGKPAVAFADQTFHIVWRGESGRLQRFFITCPHF